MHLPITTSEALIILEAHKRKIVNDPITFNKTEKYLVEFAVKRKISAIEDLSSTLSNFGLNQEEIVQVQNLVPDTVDKLKVLIPSLARIDDEKLDLIARKMQHSK